MQIFSDNTQKRNVIVGLTAGIIQILYISIMSILTNWERISDPIAFSIHYYVLLPSSIILCIIAPIAGYFYSNSEYTKPIKYSLFFSVALATIVSISMQVSGVFSISDIFINIFSLSLILSALSLSFALTIGKNI